MQSDFEAIKANLFAASHAAILDWNAFPWHRDSQDAIQTHKVQSSQALAIDVFGTIKVSPDRHRLLGSLAQKCGLPEDGPWEIELEWIDQKRLLGERRPTQIDAIAFGARALLVIECKFTESGGRCTQPDAISSDGAHKGLRQCNGNYEMQTNPVNGVDARCALTGKGIRYWDDDAVPKLFGLSADHDHRPCPFKGEAYQWMRNVVLADRLASARGVRGAVIAAYADSDKFPLARKVRSGFWESVVPSVPNLVTPMSFQSIVTLAQSLSARPSEWNALASWVLRKIGEVEAIAA
jgi:hypothetical protein